MVKIAIKRRFPVYEFVLVVQEPLVEVRRRLVAEFRANHKSTWPFPNPHLRGELSGDAFRCSPMTAAFGGNASASVRGYLEGLPDGKTGVFVRVTPWFELLIVGALVGVSVYFGVRHGTFLGGPLDGSLKSVALCGWLILVGAGLHLMEGRFVRAIVTRVVGNWPEA